MKCAHCGRTMREAWAVLLWGPVGPKCGRALGVKPVQKEPALRLAHVGRGKPDPNQRDWVQEMAA